MGLRRGRSWRARLVLPPTALAALAVGALTAEEARRGPLEARDEWLLAQPRLTLPALSPDPLPDGQTRLRLDVAWGNDFGWEQGPTDEADFYFLVDGEHRTVSFDLRHGLTPSLTVGLRLPVRWRGGGFMDGLIDAFHEVTGLPGGARLLFPADRLRVEGRDELWRPVRWRGGPGTALGNTELVVHWAFRRAAGGGWTAAAVGRAVLPTATGTFAGTGPEAGAQLVAARGLHSSVDLFLGLGGTAFVRREVRGIDYAPLRGQGFLALEWRPARRLSLVAEADATTRLVRNFSRYPGWQAYFRMGAKLDLGRRWRLEGGFAEGVKSQQATTDFGILAGLARSF